MDYIGRYIGYNVIINNQIGYKTKQKKISKYKLINKILLKLFGTYKVNTGETYIVNNNIYI